jgi:hypothetical protein
LSRRRLKSADTMGSGLGVCALRYLTYTRVYAFARRQRYLAIR